MDWLEMVLPIVEDVVVVVVLIIVGAFVKQWRNWKVEAWVKELVVDGVLFAQEKYWKLDGKIRFEQAKDWIISRLEEKGIPVSEAWIDGLIDSAVKHLRAEFGEVDWYREDEPEGISLKEVLKVVGKGESKDMIRFVPDEE